MLGGFRRHLVGETLRSYRVIDSVTSLLPLYIPATMSLAQMNVKAPQRGKAHATPLSLYRPEINNSRNLKRKQTENQ